MGIVVNALGIATVYLAFNVWVWLIVITLVGIKVYNSKTMKVLNCKGRLDGKTVLITGANDGIGYETAKELSARGARVLLACRNVGSAHVAKGYIERETKNDDIDVYECDLSSSWSVRQFCKDILENESRLDIIIFNAGIGMIENKPSKDGLPLVWQVNHYGPFLIINLLMNLIKKTKSSKIIFVTSMVHVFNKLDLNDLDCKNKKCPWTILCNTRMANILTANYLAQKLKDTNITVNCVNPGLVNMPILRRIKSKYFQYFLRLFLDMYGKSPENGAATTLTVALDEKLNGVTGQYFANCKISKCVSSKASDLKLAEQLWKKSEAMTGLYEDEKCFQ